METKTLSKLITAKLEDEFSSFKETMLRLSQTEVWEYAYEITIKSEILNCVQEQDNFFDFLPETSQARMLHQNDLLHILYTCWKNSKSSLQEVIAEGIEDVLKCRTCLNMKASILLDTIAIISLCI